MPQLRAGGGQVSEETRDDVFFRIATHYLMGGCDGCDFLEVGETCDARPINCKWMLLHHYFKEAEE